MKKILASIVLAMGFVGTASAEMSSELKALKAATHATTRVITAACVMETNSDAKFNECMDRYFAIFKTEFDKSLNELKNK